MNERPVCHRAEDLVTYLYGEAGETDSLDFREHLKVCDACRGEFAVFHQVHDSIAVWRNAVLDSSFNPAIATQSVAEAPRYVPPERRLSALAAIREFFSVSPLWLRGATAFAALLLCVLAILTVSRMRQAPLPIATNNPEVRYTRQDLDKAVQQGIDKKLAELQNQQTPNGTAPVAAKPNEDNPRFDTAAYRNPSKKTRPKGLTLREREQLAADLRLLPGADDEELPFGVSADEPNQ